jgi:GNAT superfamily N-acetyltransferase
MLEAFERPEFAAFGNHLAFLGKHRGRLNVDASGWTLTGASDELSCWTPRTDTVAVPSWCKAVRLAPWAGAVWDECLPRAGFAPGERLAYMELERLALAHRTAGNVTIEVARSGTALREFAAVQAAGFATGDAAVDDWWRPFFTEVALANRLDAEQSFYLARVGDEAAATTLVVRAAGVAGIYAVATHPEFRRRGLAQALLARACADAAAEHGIERVILQATAGSYPERYYAKLGFRQAYVLTVWRRGDE